MGDSEDKEKYKPKYRASYNPTIFEFETMNLLMRGAFNKKMQFEEFYIEAPGLALQTVVTLYDYYRFTRRLMGSGSKYKKKGEIDDRFRDLKHEAHEFENFVAIQEMNGLLEYPLIRNEISKKFWGIHEKLSDLFDMCMEEAQMHGLGFTASKVMSSEDNLKGVFSE